MVSPPTSPITPTARRVLCDHVLGNVADAATLARLTGRTRDSVRIEWPDLARRALRKTSDLGWAVGILLPLGTTLRHGDVLYEDESRYLVADLVPSDLWLALPATPEKLALVAIELGNLHVPVEVSPGGEIYTPVDGPAAGVFRRHGVACVSCRRRFAPLRSTVAGGVRLSPGFKVVAAPAG